MTDSQPPVTSSSVRRLSNCPKGGQFDLLLHASFAARSETYLLLFERPHVVHVPPRKTNVRLAFTIATMRRAYSQVDTPTRGQDLGKSRRGMHTVRSPGVNQIQSSSAIRRRLTGIQIDRQPAKDRRSQWIQRGVWVYPRVNATTFHGRMIRT
jgi:hypothetical protein